MASAPSPAGDADKSEKTDDTAYLLPTDEDHKKACAAKCRLTSTSSGDYLTDDCLPRSVRKNGRFILPWPCSKLPSLGGVVKMGLFGKDHSKIPSKQELDRTLPVMTPDQELLATPPENGIRVTWIGHSTVLVQMDKITFLTDPIFSSRCSPFQFAGPKRFREVPCTIHDLPKIDAVVISHNHYDHLDFNSVQILNARFGADVRWFVPLGLASWMHNMGCENVMELDWWDENCIPEHPEIRFVFTPAQHWCKRGPLDDNKVLWGSYCVIGPWNKFFFAGDTGYCGVFEQIGEKYGPFDCCAIPIGAYEPRWFMSFQHIDPCEAVQLHIDLKSKRSLGVHWGTFNLAYEFYLEPPEKLQDAMKEKGLSPCDFFTLKHGEAFHIGDHIMSMD